MYDDDLPEYDHFDEIIDETIREHRIARREVALDDSKRHRRLVAAIAGGKISDTTPLTALGIDCEEKHLSLARYLDNRGSLGIKSFLGFYRLSNPTVGDVRRLLSVLPRRAHETGPTGQAMKQSRGENNATAPQSDDTCQRSDSSAGDNSPSESSSEEENSEPNFLAPKWRSLRGEIFHTEISGVPEARLVVGFLALAHRQI